jgi:hypothetical protein
MTIAKAFLEALSLGGADVRVVALTDSTLPSNLRNLVLTPEVHYKGTDALGPNHRGFEDHHGGRYVSERNAPPFKKKLL